MPSITVFMLVAGITVSCARISESRLPKASLVRAIDTSLFPAPAPDPAGITYMSVLDTLLVSDSEVEEMDIYAGKNVFTMSLAGDPLGAYGTSSFSIEPTGVVYDSISNVLFFSDDDEREVFVVFLGPDGLFDTPDDTITSFDTSAFGSLDPEGIAFDSLQEVLYLVDGANAEVHRISPGANGVFDGILPAGDDRVIQFDTVRLGVKDPEGIAFDPATGNLFVVGEPVDRIVELTTSGELVRAYDISAAHPVNPAGLTFAPGSLDLAVTNLYIVDRGIDNNDDPHENDGRVYEMSLASTIEEEDRSKINDN